MTTAEQRLLGHISVKLLEWYLFILLMQRSQLTTYSPSLPVRFSMAVAGSEVYAIILRWPLSLIELSVGQ